jgi:hypothetical protein
MRRRRLRWALAGLAATCVALAVSAVVLWVQPTKPGLAVGPFLEAVRKTPDEALTTSGARIPEECNQTRFRQAGTAALSND